MSRQGTANSLSGTATPGHSNRYWPSFRRWGRSRSAAASPLSAAETSRADVTLLECDEDDEREAIEAARQAGFDEVLLEYQRVAADITARNIWDGRRF